MNYQLKSNSKYFFQQWRICTQILCFAVVSITIIGVCLFASSWILLNLTIEYLQEASLCSLQTENQHQINRFIQLQTYLSSNYFEDQFQKLRIVDQLFQFNQEMNVTTVDPLQCLNQSAGFDDYAAQTQFCYSYFGSDQTQINQTIDSQFKKLSSAMTQYLSVLGNDVILYFSSVSEDQYFSIFNQSLKSTFVPNQRQWYIDHMNYMNSGQQYIMSAPYFSQQDEIHLAFSHNLSLLDNQFVGIVAEDIDFSLMPRFKYENIEMQMINFDDQLIISNLYEKYVNQIYTVYDEALTGVNQQDWQQLKDKSTKVGYYTQLIKSRTLNKNLLVSIITLKNPDIYILLYYICIMPRLIDDEKYRQDQSVLLNQYEQWKTYYRNFYLLIFIQFTILCLIFQFFFIQWMQKDLKKLKYIAFTTIYKQYFTQKIYSKLQLPQYTQSLRDLYFAFSRIQTFHSDNLKKSTVCKHLENLQYPKKYRLQTKKLLRKLKELIPLVYPVYQVKNIRDIFKYHE